MARFNRKTGNVIKLLNDGVYSVVIAHWGIQPKTADHAYPIFELDTVSKDFKLCEKRYNALLKKGINCSVVEKTDRILIWHLMRE
jgi:hypothetical protein